MFLVDGESLTYLSDRISESKERKRVGGRMNVSPEQGGMHTSASIPIFAIEDCNLQIPLASTTTDSPNIHRKSSINTSNFNAEEASMVGRNSNNGAVISQRVDISEGKDDDGSRVKSRISKFFPRIASEAQVSRSAETRPNHLYVGQHSHIEGPSTSRVDPFGTSDGMKPVKSESNFIAMLTADRKKQGFSGSFSEFDLQSEFLLASQNHNISRSRDLLSTGSSPKRGARGFATKSQSTLEDDYLVQAAQFISCAQKSEAEACYDLAFSCYKSAVNLLLQGVQGEKDLSRRNAVRKKTSKYLLKAERIYRSYLAFDSSSFDVQKWAADFTLTSPCVQDPTLISFQGSYSEMKSYKFVQHLGNGTYLVATDSELIDIKPNEKQSAGQEEDHRKAVLKFLDKTWYLSQQKDAPLTVMENYVPLNVPFMANLVKFYETETAVVLLIQLVQNGRLWDFLSDYFHWKKQKTLPPEMIQVAEGKLIEISPRSKPTEDRDNQYVGRRVLFSIGEGGSGRKSDSSMHSDEDFMDEDLNPFERSDASVFGKILGHHDSGDSILADMSTTSSNQQTSENPFIDQTHASSLSQIAPVEKRRESSLSSVDSLLVDTSCYHTGTSLPAPINIKSTGSSGSPSTSLSSPNPDLKFQNVFRKLSTEMGVFSIIDEEGDDATISPFLKPVMTSAPVELEGSSTTKASKDLSPEDGVDELEMDGKDSAGGCDIDEDIETESDSKDLDIQEREIGPNMRWPEGQDLPESVVKLWMGQLLVALTHLHADGLIVKDLRPSNLLLGKEGELVLSYCSEWACVDRGINLQALRQLYSAPEIGYLKKEELTEACDWWSVGVLLYELICGWGITSRTNIPFIFTTSSPTRSPIKAFRSPSKLSGNLHTSGSAIDSLGTMALPPESPVQVFSPEAQDLLNRLLAINPKERLGEGDGGVEDIRSHPFFRDLPWPQIDLPPTCS